MVVFLYIITKIYNKRVIMKIKLNFCPFCKVSYYFNHSLFCAKNLK